MQNLYMGILKKSMTYPYSPPNGPLCTEFPDSGSGLFEDSIESGSGLPDDSTDIDAMHRSTRATIEELDSDTNTTNWPAVTSG